jgi:4-hydroxy-L-threonine phosphate dehydrogenase PdxA
VTYVAAVGAALMRRGRAAASAAEVQAERVTATAQQTTREMVQATGPLGAQTALLVHEGLDNIIEQITQEEYTVMVTLPLVKFVLQRTNQRTGDPLQDATAFLRLVYGGRSNFERLLAIFPEMYVAAAISG